MKKVSIIIAAVLLVLALAACGRTSSGNAVTELLDRGYSFMSVSATESSWKGILKNEESPDKLYLGKAEITKEEYDKYSNIEFDDDEGLRNFLKGLKKVTVTDISDKIPSQETLNAYIGKTLGDLENDGFENSGYTGDNGVYSFFYDGPVYSCLVSLKEGTVIEDMDDYSANDLRALEIGSVKFIDLSISLIESL